MFKRRRWNYIEKEYIDTFLGEEVIKSYIKFRFDDKIAQELCSEWSGDYWETLTDEERKILLSKIVKKGDKFVIPVRKRKKGGK